MERQAGNLGAALEAYEAGLAIREALTAQDPSNAEWQRDLFISHVKMGLINEAEGNVKAALDHATSAEALMAALCKKTP